MAERRALFTEESLGTVIAVSFVIALLAVGFGIYDLLQIRALTGYVAVQQVATANAVGQIGAIEARLAAIEERLAAIEQRPAAPPAPAVTPP